MLRTWQFRTLMALGIAALCLAVANGLLFTQNRDSQAALNTQQQYLQQTVGLESLYRDIVKALAELAVKNNDTQLLQMLTAQGVNVSVTPVAVPAPATLSQPPAASSKR